MHSWRLIDTRLICVFSSCITDVHQMSFVLRIFNSGMCSCLTFSLSASKKWFNSLTSVGAQQEIKATSCHRNFFPVCIQTLCCWVCGEEGLCHGSVELSRQREAPALPEVGGLNPTGSWRGVEAQLNSRCFWFFHRKSSPSRAASRSLSCTNDKRAAWNKRHFMDDKNESVFLFITCSLNTSVYAPLAQQPLPSALSSWIGISARRLMCYVAPV